MPGSVGDPVRIGPFRRIVEVGWPAGILAFQVFIGNETADNASTPCSPSTGPDNGNDSSYMTAASMEVTVGGGRRYHPADESWAPISATFEGEPEEPFETTFGDAEASATYAEPHRFTLAAGSAIPDIPVPDHPGETFTGSVELGYDVLARPLDAGGGVCTFDGVTAPTLQYPAAGPLGAVASGSIDLAAVVMSYLGREYTPRGCFLKPNTKGANPTVEIEAPIVAWVLCEPIEETA